MKSPEKMTIAELRAALAADGYYDLAYTDKAHDVREAAKSGSLLWTKTRLATTDSSRIDARPQVSP